jgi:hypothetical protein
MRAGVENVNAQRQRADELQTSIVRITDRARRAELLASLSEARTAINEATAGIHAFDLRTLTERVETATRRLDLVAAALMQTAG